MTWDEADDLRLRGLWTAGLSTYKIGIEMKRTKNSIVGRAHRLGLPGRRSPIICTGAPRIAAKPVRQPKVTLPPILKGVEEKEVKHLPAVVVTSVRRENWWGACCWPIGEPRSTAFRFCGAACDTKRPYCEAHADVARARPAQARPGTRLAREAALWV